MRLKNSSLLLSMLLLSTQVLGMQVVWQRVPVETFEGALALCDAVGAVMCLPRNAAEDALLAGGTWWVAAGNGSLVSHYTGLPLTFPLSSSPNSGHWATTGNGTWVAAARASVACCVLEARLRVRWPVGVAKGKEVVVAEVCGKGYACAGEEAPPTPCLNGTYSDATATSSCSACPAGSYTPPSSVAEQCVACSPGTYAPYRSSNRCLPCAQGTFWANKRDAACPLCPVGAYCPSPSQSSLQCPSYTSTTEAGRQSKLDCLCADGHVCTYVKRIVVTLQLTVPANTTQLVEALSRAAGVSVDKVTVVSRRSLEVTAFVEGTDSLSRAPAGLAVRHYHWEPRHWVLPRPSIQPSTLIQTRTSIQSRQLVKRIR